MSQQKKELARVRSKTENAIIEFVGTRRFFTGPGLHAAVRKKVPDIAPGSPDRIMRDLRSRGVITVHLVSRSKSLYRNPSVPQ